MLDQTGAALLGGFLAVALCLLLLNGIDWLSYLGSKRYTWNQQEKKFDPAPPRRPLPWDGIQARVTMQLIQSGMISPFAESEVQDSTYVLWLTSNLQTAGYEIEACGGDVCRLVGGPYDGCRTGIPPNAKFRHLLVPVHRSGDRMAVYEVGEKSYSIDGGDFRLCDFLGIRLGEECREYINNPEQQAP